MKREYTKPDILFESFSLSTSIAGNCAVKTFLPSPGACGLPFGSTVIFTSGVTGCHKKFQNGISYDGVCYDNPLETNNLFRS